MECHSIQFTTISINVERGIVKILFKYRYFQDLLINIDIFQNHLIDIDIFGIALSISIFSKMTISILISISIFFKSVDISTIDMSYRYIEQGYKKGFIRTFNVVCIFLTVFCISAIVSPPFPIMAPAAILE